MDAHRFCRPHEDEFGDDAEFDAVDPRPFAVRIAEYALGAFLAALVIWGMATHAARIDRLAGQMAGDRVECAAVALDGRP